MSSEPHPAAVLDAVERLGPPGTPVTLREVADGAGIDHPTTRDRLAELVANGTLEHKSVGDAGHVWWRVSTTETGTNTPTSERLSHAVEDSPLVLFGLDTDLRYTWVENPNPDFREGEVLGKRDDELLPESAAEVLLEPKQRALESGNRVREELSFDLPSGPVTYDLTVQPTRDEAGTIVGLTCVSFEVTERKHYERELERRTDELETLYRLIRHDIRNDMAIILGWAKLLEGHVDTDARPFLERVLRSSQRIVELTDATAGAVEALVGQGTATTSPMPLAPVLNAELELVSQGFPDATIEAEPVGSDVNVVANEMLGSVLKNVLQNAVKHSDSDRPHVEVTCSLTDETVELRVADDGPGIPDAQKETVFDRGVKSAGSGGNGIGLYVVQTLAKQYGGSIHVEDNEPQGAVFVTRLQRAA